MNTLNSKVNDFINYDFKGLGEFLNQLSPIEFGALGSIIGLLISIPLSNNEQNSIGNLLELIGQVVLTVQAQGSNQEPPTPTTSDIEALKKRIDDLYFFIKKKHN